MSVERMAFDREVYGVHRVVPEFAGPAKVKVRQVSEYFSFMSARYHVLPSSR